jgi:hypothetical protein
MKNTLIYIIIILSLIILFCNYTNIEYFNNNSFDFTKGKIIKINNNNFNSFIYKIDNIKNNKQFYQILKSNIGDINEDNLIYEYYVGLYINKFVNKFPCFIKTYNIFQYKNKDIWEIFKNSYDLESNILNTSFNNINNINDLTCNNYIAILLEYVNNYIPLKYKLLDTHFIENELIFVLFQIFFPLYTLNNTFSHNDINYNNILLQKTPDNKYIHFHYILNDNFEINFKSQYTVKIIDYGNTYFYENEYNNTLQLYEFFCSKTECDNDCYKYSTTDYYKKHIIENYLIEDIILYCNEQFSNNTNIIFLKTIIEHNINNIYNTLLLKLQKITISKHKTFQDIYIYQNGDDMKYI